MVSESSVGQAVSQYAEGVAVSEIARRAGTSTFRVSLWLEKAGVREIVPLRADPIRDAAIVRAYADGVSFREMIARFRVTNSWIVVVARRQGLPPRARGSVEKTVSSVIKERALAEYRDGKPVMVIARELKIGHCIVRRILREAGIEYEPRRHGDKTGRWHRGEWRREDHGYVSVKLLETDPLFCMTDSAGYVLEHRYVMAKKIKRALIPNETVHHKDGDKKNNKLRNLQLRHGKHGKNECYQCGDCGSRNVKAVSI